MMGLKIVIFALLLISLQHTVGDSSKAIPADDVSKTERAELSHYLHHPHRRSLWGLVLKLFKPQKNKDKTPFNSIVKWKPKESQDNLYSFSMNSQDEYNIAIDEECKPCLVKTDTTVCVSSTQKPVKFLVNSDYFEALEWKPYTFGSMPPFPVESCNGYIIARHKNETGFTKKAMIPKITIGSETKILKNIEVLVQNYENVTEEYLTNIQFDAELVHRNKKPDLFRNLTIVNNNCKEMKQQVKVDNSFEETATYAIGDTLLIGGSIGFKDKVELGLKADISATETETNSNIKKNGYGYIQDLEIPRLSSCNIVINSNILITNVPFTADLTRVYKNNDIRTTSINGNYTYQKSAEIKTNFESCVKLPGKC